MSKLKCLLLCAGLLCVECPAVVQAGEPEIVIDGVVVQESEKTAAQRMIDDAVSFAVGVAEDNSHGYNNKGNGYGPDEYNCIGLVIRAYQHAGVNVRSCNIPVMPERLQEAGFVEITSQVNLQTGEGLVKGDILWYLDGTGKHGHTELYTGNGSVVGARGDTDGVPGDSQGNEIVTAGYSNLGWQKVFRLPDGYAEDPDPITIETMDPDIVVLDLATLQVETEYTE